MSERSPEKRWKVHIVGWLATAAILLALDLFWLGLFAREFYAQAMGALLRPQAYAPAAVAFYLFYVTVIWVHCGTRSRSTTEAWQRGAGLGFVCYGVYELTNWAVIANWPVILVPTDWIWGTILTGTAAAAGHRARRTLS